MDKGFKKLFRQIEINNKKPTVIQVYPKMKTFKDLEKEYLTKNKSCV